MARRLFYTLKGTTIVVMTIVIISCIFLHTQFQSVHSRITTLESYVLKEQRDNTAQLLEIEHRVNKMLLRFGVNDSIHAMNNEESPSSALEQARRRRVMQLVCEKHEKSRNLYTYKSKSGYYDQTLNNNFLVESKSRTLYCIVHKAASSTWMSLFTRIYRDQDPDYADHLIQTGAYYKIWYKMGPSGSYEIWDKLSSGDYFSFLVVRHPLDRLLSAFRDRILNPCTKQAKQYVPRIFKFFGLPDQDKLMDTSGCVTLFPSFEQFLRYISTDPASPEPHWAPVSSLCAPCLLPYDAVIKLETSEPDEAYVLSHSRLNQYANLEVKHRTKGGSTQDARRAFYSDVSCDTLKRIEHFYKMDFELFEYDTQEFYNWCQET